MFYAKTSKTFCFKGDYLTTLFNCRIFLIYSVKVCSSKELQLNLFKQLGTLLAAPEELFITGKIKYLFWNRRDSVPGDCSEKHAI